MNSGLDTANFLHEGICARLKIGMPQRKVREWNIFFGIQKSVWQSIEVNYPGKIESMPLCRPWELWVRGWWQPCSCRGHSGAVTWPQPCWQQQLSRLEASVGIWQISSNKSNKKLWEWQKDLVAQGDTALPNFKRWEHFPTELLSITPSLCTWCASGKKTPWQNYLGLRIELGL